MPRRELNGKRVLITGASQGIGFALAVGAAARGCKVIAAARSPELLNTLVQQVRAAGGTIEPVTADVTDPAGRRAMVETAEAEFGGLDVLVNNAGIGATGHFVESKPETLRQIFEVNLFGLAELTRLCLPVLKAGQQPLIVNISSVVGKRGFPGRSLYSASKYAVQGFSDALRAELSDDGITVLVVSPGLTRTNFSHNMLERTARMAMDHMRGMTSEEVAEKTLRAMEADKYDATFTLGGNLLVFVNRFFPGLFERIARKRVRKTFADEIAARKPAAEQTAAQTLGTGSG